MDFRAEIAGKLCLEREGRVGLGDRKKGIWGSGEILLRAQRSEYPGVWQRPKTSQEHKVQGNRKKGAQSHQRMLWSLNFILQAGNGDHWWLPALERPPRQGWEGQAHDSGQEPCHCNR